MKTKIQSFLDDQEEQADTAEDYEVVCGLTPATHRTLIALARLGGEMEEIIKLYGPKWEKPIPKGMDPTFYMGCSYENEEKAKAAVESVLCEFQNIVDGFPEVKE